LIMGKGKSQIQREEYNERCRKKAVDGGVKRKTLKIAVCFDEKVQKKKKVSIMPAVLEMGMNWWKNSMTGLDDPSLPIRKRGEDVLGISEKGLRR